LDSLLESDIFRFGFWGVFELGLVEGVLSESINVVIGNKVFNDVLAPLLTELLDFLNYQSRVAFH